MSNITLVLLACSGFLRNLCVAAVPRRPVLRASWSGITATFSHQQAYRGPLGNVLQDNTRQNDLPIRSDLIHCHVFSQEQLRQDVKDSGDALQGFSPQPSTPALQFANNHTKPRHSSKQIQLRLSRAKCRKSACCEVERRLTVERSSI